jgi:hypothetical protein
VYAAVQAQRRTCNDVTHTGSLLYRFIYRVLLILLLFHSKTRIDSAFLKRRTSVLDTVSTGSGSDLVSDQHANFPIILDPHPSSLTRSLPLPVLTVSKNDSGISLAAQTVFSKGEKWNGTRSDPGTR